MSRFLYGRRSKCDHIRTSMAMMLIVRLARPRGLMSHESHCSSVYWAFWRSSEYHYRHCLIPLFLSPVSHPSSIGIYPLPRPSIVTNHATRTFAHFFTSDPYNPHLFSRLLHNPIVLFFLIPLHFAFLHIMRQCLAWRLSHWRMIFPSMWICNYCYISPIKLGHDCNFLQHWI